MLFTGKADRDVLVILRGLLSHAGPEDDRIKWMSDRLCLRPSVRLCLRLSGSMPPR